MDPGMALSSSFGLDNILALGESTGSSDQDGSGGSMALDTTKATGCGHNPEILCDIWWKYGTWILPQTLAMIGPQTQTWSLGKPGLDVTVVSGGSADHSDLHRSQWQCGFQTPTCPGHRGICTAFDGNRSLRHQHRP